MKPLNRNVTSTTCALVALLSLAGWAIWSLTSPATGVQPPPRSLPRHQAGDAAAASPAAPTGAPHPGQPPPARGGAAGDYGKVPLSFEVNQGQADPEVKFLARGDGYNIFFTPTEVVLALSDRRGRAKNSKEGTAEHPPAHANGDGGERKSASLRLKLLDSDPSAQVAGADKRETVSNYYIGKDPAKWRTGVPHFSKVRYGNVYPGVDAVYYGNRRSLEFDFILAPGTNPEIITLGFEGAQELSVDEAGDLVLRTPAGEVRLHKPITYQQVGGERREVASAYALKGGDRVGFTVGDYDASQPLIIDPVLGYATYFGGSAGGDGGTDLAVDYAGEAIISGQANSPNLPTKNAIQGSMGSQGYSDAFVAKFNADGSDLIYSTFVGGNLDDISFGTAADRDRNVYIAGFTTSPNFPTTPGAFQGSNAGDNDAFVLKLSPTGTLIYSTCVGGSGDDIANDVALDAEGNAYLVGKTRSSNYKVTPNSFQSTAPNDGYHGFLTKVNPAGSALLYSTYLGGPGNDTIHTVAAADAGMAYFAGYANGTFPTTTTAYAQTAFGVFAGKIDTRASGSAALVFSTFLDSLGPLGLITLDDFGNIFAASGSVVKKFSPSGDALLYTASVDGVLRDIAADTAGNLYATGLTRSQNFRVSPSAFQKTYGGGDSDAIVVKLSAKDGAVKYSTLLGGGGFDTGISIALDRASNVYASGTTFSTNFPVTQGAFQTTKNTTDPSQQQGWVAKLPDLRPLIFVPGIGGSYIDYRQPGGEGINLWPGLALSLLEDDRQLLSLDPRVDTGIDPNHVIVPDVMRTVILPEWVTRRGGQYVQQNLVIYGSLLDMLTDGAGGRYSEYQVNDDPRRRTTSGCDYEGQKDDLPDLFVFAYDWRKSNVENAQKLKDFVGCVQKFYPDGEVDILTHSMGSLLARRYIIDNPDTHHVNKLITMNGPWLGAPLAIAALETGESNFPSILIKQPTLKKLGEFYPGLHELLPSRSYYQLVAPGAPYQDHGTPFGESAWDLNRNGHDTELYTYDQQVDVLDYLHDGGRPGTNGKAFHDRPGQDDWREDKSGVTYDIIWTRQKRNDTLGYVLAYSSGLTCIEGDCWLQGSYLTGNVAGDGTVPTPSLERGGNLPGNLHPSARFWFYTSPDERIDYRFEHMGMTQTPFVHSTILYVLGRGPRPRIPEIFPPAGQTGGSIAADVYPAPPPSPSNFLTVNGVGQVIVTDGEGNNNAAVTETFPGFPFPVPNVSYLQTGPRTVKVGMPTSLTYDITFRTSERPVSIEFVTGVSDRAPDAAVRYADLALPSDVAAKLTVTPQGAQHLVLDVNSDGIYETTVPPTVAVSGAAALDVTPPAITFNEVRQGAASVVRITAQDAQAGVKAVKYSFDGVSFHTYAGELTMNPSSTPVVYAFADDNVGNRSNLATYRLKTNAKIAFASNRTGNSEVYLMNPEGGGQVNVSNNSANDEEPVWSPDGTKIAFATDRHEPSENYEIYLMDADGGNQVRLTNLPGSSSNQPLWSPDGSKIAFLNFVAGQRHLWVVNADGSSPTRLTAGPADGVRWSPDGSKLSFDSNQAGGRDVYVVDAGGGGQTRLTSSPADEHSAAWSPDGARIAFVGAAGGNPEIYLMDAGGGGQTRLTVNPAAAGYIEDALPTWSPDGSMIAFHHFVAGAGGQHVYVMNADGSEQKSLGFVSNAFNRNPLAWSPDGTKIVSAGDLGGDIEVFTMSPDGGQPTNLSSTPDIDSSPSWQPDAALAASDLEVGISHAPDFVAGEAGTYTVTVRNRGITASAGTIKVTDALPPGLSFTSWGGADWSCAALGQVVTCTSDRSLARGAVTGFTLSVAIANNAGLSVVNDVRLSNVSDVNLSNNFAGDFASVLHPSIKGRVTDGGGAGVAGVALTLSGAQSAGASTDSGGYYVFGGLVRGANYTVTPSLAAHTFTPPSSSFSAIAGDNTADFAALPVTPTPTPEPTPSPTPTPTPTPEPTPVYDPNGLVAFTGYRDGNAEVYVMNPDGSGQTRLTNAPGMDTDPAWSPDGRRILFVSDRGADGKRRLYTMRADGSDVSTVTPGGGFYLRPVYSPDGTKIAVSFNGEGTPDFGPNGVYVMNADGTGARRLTGGNDQDPAWSPDGTKLAFRRNLSTGNSDIFMMNADGTNPVNITNTPYPQLEADVAWSPDGSRLAFRGNEQYGRNAVFTMNPDGTGRTPLTDFSQSHNYAPRWSPDGQRLVFHTERDGAHEVYAMGADGSNQTRLTNHPSYDSGPAWQRTPATPTPTPTPSPTPTPAPTPVNGKIVFTSYRDNNNEIYTMEPDGTNQTRLTFYGGNDQDPVWSPDGTKIAFVSDRNSTNVFVMNADGSNVVQVTNDWMGGGYPAWSPDGTKLAYVGGPQSQRGIYVVNADGTSPACILPATTTLAGGQPAWSPDGAKIAFRGSTADHSAIYVMNADGTNPVRLTFTPSPRGDFEPKWSPDGAKIVFSSNRGGYNKSIFVMNADGTNQTRLTSSFTGDLRPAFSPDGTKIVYWGYSDTSKARIRVMNANGSNQHSLTDETGDNRVPHW